MKTSRGVIVFCLLTVLSVSCERTFNELESINDLKEVFRFTSVPRHALLLLFWFADRIGFEENNAVCINFDPEEDHHFHTYGNYDGLLDTVSKFNSYFPVDKLYNVSELIFPDRIRVMQFNQDGHDRDRIIMCVHTRRIQNNLFVSEVFLTRHFRMSESQGSRYDPDYTYRITPNLLRQLKMFSSNNNYRTLEQLRNQFDNNIDNNQLDRVRVSWRDDVRLGLLYLIVMPESYEEASNLNMICNRESDLAEISCEWHNCGLEVLAGDKGKARISWRDVTEEKLNAGVAVALYSNQTHQGGPLTYKYISVRKGILDTSVPMNEGLQVRLHKVGLSGELKEEICRGKEFKSPRATPITLAQLQLFAKDGNACFRLFIHNTIALQDKRNGFAYNSWVGLYTNKLKLTRDYLSEQWQWVRKFEEGKDVDMNSVLEYCTGTKITPRLQARLNDGYVEIARTPEWRFP
uniref:Lipoprotein n=1 Tax=Neogobius melanostomus TaxID=47308 RepID=A0A8C6SD02_9GOBI